MAPASLSGLSGDNFRGGRLESGQRLTEVTIQGQPVTVEGTQSGYIVIFGKDKRAVGHIPGDPPTVLDNGESVEAIPLPPVDPYLEPML